MTIKIHADLEWRRDDSLQVMTSRLWAVRNWWRA